MTNVVVEIKSLFKFCQGMAHIWDIHELALAKLERSLQDKLEESRKKHDNKNLVSSIVWGFFLDFSGCV